MLIQRELATFLVANWVTGTEWLIYALELKFKWYKPHISFNDSHFPGHIVPNLVKEPSDKKFLFKVPKDLCKSYKNLIYGL